MSHLDGTELVKGPVPTRMPRENVPGPDQPFERHTKMRTEHHESVEDRGLPGLPASAE